MRFVILLLLAASLSCADPDQELKNLHAKIPTPVHIVFELTVINLDKKTKETKNMEEDFVLKDFEQTYRPLTLLELKTYESPGYIKTLPVTITIQTL